MNKLFNSVIFVFAAVSMLLLAAGFANAAIVYSIAPVNQTALLGQTVQYSATASENGAQILANFSWAVTPINGSASINSTGSLVATGTGAVQVTATDANLSRVNSSVSTLLTIAAGPVTAITLSPSSLGLNVNIPAVVQATCLNAFNASISCNVSWSTSDASVLKLVSTPTAVQVTALKEGNATITASQNGVTASINASAALTKVPVALQLTAPQTTVTVGTGMQLNATLIDQLGNPMTSSATITWSLSGVSAYIDQNGYFVSYANGTSTVTATVNGLSASLIITSVLGSPTQLVFYNSNNLAEAVAGIGYELSVYAQDAYGNNLSTPLVTYSIENTSGNGYIYTSANESYFVGVLIGAVRIIATSRSNSSLIGYFDVEVVPGTPESLEVQSETGLFKLYEGETLQLHLYGEDYYGNVIPEEYIFKPTWTITGGTGQATISSSGILTATKAGTVNLQASLGYTTQIAKHSITIMQHPSNTTIAVPAGTYGAKPSDKASTITVHAPLAAQTQSNGAARAIADEANSAAASATGLFTLGFSSWNLFWIILLAVILICAFFLIGGYVHSKANEQPHYSEQSVRDYLLK